MATEDVVSVSPPADRAGDERAVTAPALPLPAQRALKFALLLSAVRCTVQYVLIPFVLPWVGLAASVPPWLTLALGGLAILSLVRNVALMWRLHHARRWSYLFLAVVMTGALLVFAVVDLHSLLRP
jgi:ABC-type iron transport system FetAB permease component